MRVPVRVPNYLRTKNSIEVFCSSLRSEIKVNQCHKSVKWLARITKLKGLENWRTWKFQIRIMILASEALDVITGESVKSERTQTKLL